MTKISVKIGSRHSKSDQDHLDSAMSHLADAGANLPAPPPHPDAVRVAEANAEAAAVNKSAAVKDSDKASDYLVVEDPKQSSTWHLQVSNNGTPDHRLMGASWAALHGGYRGNKYEGPHKQEAIDKLTALYKREKMDTPAKSVKAIDSTMIAACVAACQACIDACDECLESCQTCPNSGDYVHQACAEYCKTCITYCAICLRTCETGDMAEIADDCAACADACDRCNQVCQQCAISCEVCNADCMACMQCCNTCRDACDACAQAAPVDSDEPAAMMSKDAVVFHGGTLKALGGGKFGGYLVVFSDDKHPDLTGDFFTKDTDFGDHVTTPVYYHHGLDGTLKSRTLDNAATLKRDEVGVWVEGQMKLRDEYESYIYSQIEAGKEGLSSGTAAHLVEREKVGKSFLIKRWPLGLDASITPTPAEPRTMVLPLKSLSVNAELKALLQAAGDAATAGEASASVSSSVGENTMPENANAAPDLVAAITANTKAIEALLAKPGAQIESKAGFAGVQAMDVKDPRPFKSFGEQLIAVVRASSKEDPVIDKRLYEVKAPTGLNESVPSEGGFLVQTDFSTALLERLYETNTILDRCSTINISAASNGAKINAFDETSRVDGSRWGGVLAYWASEAGQKTASKPKFRQIELLLKKLVALCYATDENLQDAQQLESVLMRVFPMEMGFRAEDAVINGSGAGLPLGILNSPALVTVAKEAGQAAGTIVYPNIIKMWSRLWNRSAANAVWLANQDALPQLYTMSLTIGVGGSAVFLPPTGASGSPYATLFGRPLVPCEYCATVGTVGDIMLVDLTEYLLAKKGGIQSASSIHLRFDYDETVFRFVMRLDGAPAWYSALTPKNGSNTVSPYIALATRA